MNEERLLGCRELRHISKGSHQTSRELKQTYDSENANGQDHIRNDHDPDMSKCWAERGLTKSSRRLRDQFNCVDDYCCHEIEVKSNIFCLKANQRHPSHSGRPVLTWYQRRLPPSTISQLLFL